MVVLGLDESYTRIGVSVAKDNKIITSTSYNYRGCKTKTDKRIFVKKMVKHFLRKYRCDVVIVERVRHFSQGFMSKDYIMATSALVATIVDTAYLQDIPVYSVDTRSWKAQVVGTATHNKSESTKQPTLDFVKNTLNIDAKNDDQADAICISLYWFIDEKLKKLKKEN